jgi:endonuclease/exonuclease/phosphatase family metal-dependent hydrolase
MKIIKILGSILLLIIIIAIIFVGVLTAFEYKPNNVEEVIINNNQANLVELNTSIKLMTFNIGYAGLGKDEDFILDGGKSGRPSSKEVVETYFNGIKDILETFDADIYMLQEVDLKSRRSYQINQFEELDTFLGSSYSSQFAYNFKSIFVPFPLSFSDHIGYVESGLATYMSYQVASSTRYQFPGEFSWPLRVANLKRAMMVSELDIQGSDKKLMVVNLHMSAYDGDGSLRAQEMAFLKEFMIEQQALGNYVIIGGDFNQTFPEADGIYEVIQDFYVAYPIETDYLPLGYSFYHDLTVPSCRLLNQPYNPNDVNTQYYIIDGFIVSSNIEVESYSFEQVNPGAVTLDLAFANSDHNPVVIKVKLLS